MEITLFKFISHTSTKIVLFFTRNHNVSKQLLVIMFHFYLHHSYLVCITVPSALLKKPGYSVTDSYPKAEDSPLSALNYLWKNPQLIADSFTSCCQLRCSLHIVTCGNQNHLRWESIYIAVSLSLYAIFIHFHYCSTTSPKLTVAHFQHGCFIWPGMVTVEAHLPKKALLLL